MRQRDFGGETVPPATADFGTVTVSIPIEEVTRLAGMQVGDIRVTETADGSELRSAGGELVAIATERTLRDGSLGTELRYRVTGDAPETRMASQIRDAIGSYVW